ncbi:hypothetical protein LXA43DRAFT_907387 [Ganoderma leucocontextum]|nr:hypothetical protein LXA43DRAFT_907387 [Ganoderma leucocontextum]
MYLGDIPDELKDLTFIEEQLVALCRAKSSIVHLKEDNSTHGNGPSVARRPNSQRGFKGHIIVYPQKPDQVARTLPPSLHDASQAVCVIFVGSRAPTLEWLRDSASPLIVRRQKVVAALQWLKTHNVLYRDVEIDLARLNALPDEDLLPVHVEHVQPSAAQDAATARYDEQPTAQTAEPELSASARNRVHDEVHFQKVVVMDVDGRAPANELRSAAVRHIKEKGGGYIEVPHGPKPVNEFCNPSLFPSIYPCLFPYGVGGFEDAARFVSVSFQRQVRHYLALADRRFQEHHSFMFTAFNIIQRRAILLHSAIKVRSKSFPHFAADFSSVSQEAVARVCARITETGRVAADTDEERKVVRLMKEAQLITTNVPGSSAARVAMRNEI